MLSYKRPAWSTTENEFINRFIDSVPGMRRDQFGNRYIFITGPNGQRSTTMISCHTDSVHSNPGRQCIARGVGVMDGLYVLDEPQPAVSEKVKAKTEAKAEAKAAREARKPRPGFLRQFGGKISGKFSASPKKQKVFYEKQCLGADDCAGVFVALNMIQARVPALYVFHRAEEVGGHGSTWIAKHNPKLLQGIERCIAIDRRGQYDIITHQMMGRCCSDTFANAFAADLNMLHEPCPFGSFTDSANYTDLIGECTNISAGYQYEHSSRENLDWWYLEWLVERMCTIDLDNLPSVRQAGEIEDWRTASDPCDVIFKWEVEKNRKKKGKKAAKAQTDAEYLIAANRLLASGNQPHGTAQAQSAPDAHQAARAYLDVYIDPYDTDYRRSWEDISIDVREADRRFHEQKLDNRLDGLSDDEIEYQMWLQDRWERD